VEVDAEEARRLGVEATPTFFFGVEVDGNVQVTDVVNGAQPFAEFERIIDRLRLRGF
jgi:protein-disulfide isomerase